MKRVWSVPLALRGGGAAAFREYFRTEHDDLIAFAALT